MSVIATAFWRRLDVSGADAARLLPAANGYELAGQAVFDGPGGPSALRYRVAYAADWSTLSGRVTGFVGGREVDDHIVRSPEGWTLNEQNFGMADVPDLDFGFTPATNMAQLRRIAIRIDGTTKFDVAWLDAGADILQALPQEYTRTSEFEYDYHAPSVGYRATLTVAANGFVAIYPGLWDGQMHGD